MHFQAQHLNVNVLCIHKELRRLSLSEAACKRNTWLFTENPKRPTQTLFYNLEDRNSKQPQPCKCRNSKIQNLCAGCSSLPSYNETNKNVLTRRLRKARIHKRIEYELPTSIISDNTFAQASKLPVFNQTVTSHVQSDRTHIP